MKIPYQLYHLRSVLVILILIVSCGISGSAQEYSSRKHWYAGPHIGVISFFGDLSVYDLNPGRKLTDESKPAWGILAGKGLNHFLDIQLSWTKGNMKGSNQGLDMNFTNSFYEIYIGPEIILSRLIWPGHRSRLELNMKSAIGFIQYRSIKYKLSDGTYLSSEGFTPERKNSGSAKTSLVIPAGIGLSYRVNHNFVLRSDFSFRLHNKDLLDSQEGSTGVSDRYSYASFGIVYVFSPADKTGMSAMECPGEFRPARKKKSWKKNKFSFR